jgi:hypothetical protein
VRQVPTHLPANIKVIPPTWSDLSHQEPRATGWGWHSPDLPSRAITRTDVREENLLDLEISDDARIALFAARGSHQQSGRGNYILESLALVLTRNVLTLAAQLGATNGYAGRWLLAAGLNDLNGKQSISALQRGILGGEYTRFSAPHYIQGTEASTRELLDQPGAVTRRLLHRLLRALRADHREHDAVLSDE